jgi:hypothetical protein
MNDIREALSAAFDETTESAPVAEVAETPPGPAAGAREEAGEAPEGMASSGEPAAPSHQRDEKGRFAPKAAQTEAPKPGGESATPAPKEAAPVATPAPQVGQPSQTPAPEAKAPQSWKPAAREHFARLPPEVQAEVVRRERETATVLQEAASARKLEAEFRQTVAPYEAMIRAEGGEPLKAVASLLQTAAALRTAPPHHKAQLVASLVKTFGVPVEALDAALVGEAPQQGQAAPEYRDPRVDQLFAQMQQAQHHRQQSLVQRSQQELETFAAGREFVDDVREEMADLLEVAAKRGVALSLEDAYNRAVQLNPDISAVLKQREAAKAATNAQASTQRARAATSSVKSQPAGAPHAPQSRGLRDDLEAALAAQSGR